MKFKKLNKSEKKKLFKKILIFLIPLIIIIALVDSILLITDISSKIRWFIKLVIIILGMIFLNKYLKKK